jgi:hypothetical protein
MENERDMFEEYMKSNDETINSLVKAVSIQREWLKKITDKSNKIASEIAIQNIDELKEQLDSALLTIKRIENKQKESEIILNAHDIKIINMDYRFNTIGLNGKGSLVQKAVKDRCFKFVRNKESILYPLFYKTYSGVIHGEINKVYDANSYLFIHIDKLQSVLSLINAWRPTESIKDKRICDLIKLNEADKLNKSPAGAKLQMALEEYIEKTQGGTKKYAV